MIGTNKKKLVYVLIFSVLLVWGLCSWMSDNNDIKETFQTNKEGLMLEGETHEERKEDFQKYIDSLPTVSRNQIPRGEEDKYILKTQIVPPVCPRCPDVINVCNDSAKKCPPCPAPQRCPEPAYECKLVPNFQRRTGDHIPKPILTDFSQFGM